MKKITLSIGLIISTLSGQAQDTTCTYFTGERVLEFDYYNDTILYEKVHDGKYYNIDHNYETLHDAINDLELNLKVWNKLKIDMSRV